MLENKKNVRKFRNILIVLITIITVLSIFIKISEAITRNRDRTAGSPQKPREPCSARK